jgi:hypothetical protein
VVVFLGLLGWSFGSIWVLNAGLRGDNDQFIPFGESGFGDARACMRCVRAGHEWKEEIAIGHMVILVDNDLDREVTGSPAGLPLYGKLAALAAGEQDRFMDFYDVMTNQDRGPPRWEHFFDPWKTDFASFLMERIDAASPSEIVWHFERPTRWEHWFVENLRKAGGRVAEFSTPLSKTPGMQVRFAWADRDALFSILRDLGERATVQDGGCVSIRPIKVTPYPSMVTHVAGSGRYDADGVPEWLVVSWTDARLGDVAMAAVPTIGSAVEAVDDGYRVRLLSIWHGEESQEIPSGRHSHRGIQLAGGGTSDCAVRVGEQWWSVDPTRGSLSTTAQRHDTIPGQEWCGIAVGTGNELLLASADQWIVRLDCLTGREKGRFRAAVWPSLRLVTNECSPVVMGNGWYATLNNLTSLLTVYDAQGGELGVRRLDDVLQLRYPSIKAIAAQGDYLAVANLGSVSTLELRVSPACTGKTSIRPTQNQEP